MDYYQHGYNDVLRLQPGFDPPADHGHESIMTIRILPSIVAAGIAAGEVVERPASVVKELVENALDAGASRVTIELLQGGMERISVTDNGCGIPYGEVETAFARHATSKLASLDDLDRITTMGFRGEALPSIAAAAHVSLVTRVTPGDAATSIEITKGVAGPVATASGAPGTTIVVDDLFANIPARRKFLRSVGAETGRVRQVVERLALGFPEVQCTLTSGDKQLFQSQGNGSLRDVWSVLHGSESAVQMLEAHPAQVAVYSVRGLISPASFSKANRSGIDLYVNRRWVQHRALTVAIEEAYRGFLVEGRFPLAALFLEVSPDALDVNVHPTKREVRFVYEGDAFSSVQRAVREALLAASPLIEAASLGPSYAGGSLAAVAPSFQFSAAADTLPVLPGPDSTSEEAGPSASETTVAGLRVLGQLANTYIVAEGPGGMYLIDQHAAHEQVLFDRLLLQWEKQLPEIQALLDPIPVEISPSQEEYIVEVLPTLEQLCWQLESFGARTLLVRAIPSISAQVSIPDLLEELLAPRRDPTLAETATHYAMAASIACHGSVRAGQMLGLSQMKALVESLERARNSHHCPHGRPTTIRVSTRMLEREFRRT